MALTRIESVNNYDLHIKRFMVLNLCMLNYYKLIIYLMKLGTRNKCKFSWQK